MNFQDIKFIISQCSHGTTLLRAFQNLDFKNKVEVSKETIDLGAKDSLYAYHQLIQKSSDTKMTYTDLHPKNEDILKINFDHEFPIDSNTFNNVLVFNVLEHVWDTRNLLTESNRVLVPGGSIYGSVPFLFRYHQDPTDYWRFTHEALLELLKQAHFTEIEVVPYGIGCFSVSVNTFSNLLRFKIFIAGLWLIALGLDSLLTRVWPQNKTYYLGVFFKAKKPKLLEAEAGIEPA